MSDLSQARIDLEAAQWALNRIHAILDSGQEFDDELRTIFDKTWDQIIRCSYIIQQEENENV